MLSFEKMRVSTRLIVAGIDIFLGLLAISVYTLGVASNNIARKVEEIATMVEDTAASMKMTAETAEELEKIVGELSALVGRFRC